MPGSRAQPDPPPPVDGRAPHRAQERLETPRSARLRGPAARSGRSTHHSHDCQFAATRKVVDDAGSTQRNAAAPTGGGQSAISASDRTPRLTHRGGPAAAHQATPRNGHLGLFTGRCSADSTTTTPRNDHTGLFTGRESRRSKERPRRPIYRERRPIRYGRGLSAGACVMNNTHTTTEFTSS